LPFDLSPRTLVILAVVTLVLVSFGFWKHWIVLTLWLLALATQLFILSLWCANHTASSVHDISPKIGNEKIFDPSLEALLMDALWMFAWSGIVTAMILTVKQLETGKPAENLRRLMPVRISSILLQLLLMILIGDNLRSFRRVDGDLGIASKLSPNGHYEVRFVPMSHNGDGLSGDVLWREQKSLWWHHAYELGEGLNYGGEFRWLSPTRFWFSKIDRVYDLETRSLDEPTSRPSIKNN
jgi:hypothetical protein